jgi:hypothetical protein
MLTRHPLINYDGETPLANAQIYQLSIYLTLWLFLVMNNEYVDSADYDYLNEV